MSWFSRSFPASFSSKERGLDDQGNEVQPEVDDNAASNSASGKGVKDDLSELTKSFTRQFWGVASFLASPPQRGSLESEEDEPSPRASNLTASGSSELQAPADRSSLPIDAVVEKESVSASVNLDNVDDNASTFVSETASLSQTHEQDSKNRLTGFRSDFAELKGSVTTGFSRIMQAVREEIEGEEVGELVDKSSMQENTLNEAVDESVSLANRRDLPSFNTILRPLFGSILASETEEDKEFSDKGDTLEEYISENVEQISQVQDGRRHISFRNTLVGGLDGISKLASSLFPGSLDSEDEDSDRVDDELQAVGMTEEVLTFARNISMHPETWLDFPALSDDEDSDEVEMSEAQQEHVAAIDIAAPRLAALRTELCPDHMSDQRFWKIYFVLLHSRLSKNDAILLSTPQIVDARVRLLQRLRKKELDGSHAISPPMEILSRKNPMFLNEQNPHDADKSSSLSAKDSEGTTESYKIVSLQAATEVPSFDFQQSDDQKSGTCADKIGSLDLPDIAHEVQTKDVLASTVKFKTHDYEEAEVDEWLHEEPSSHVGASSAAGNDEDVSFSDFEEEDEASIESSASKPPEGSVSKDTQRWVQLIESPHLKESEGFSGFYLNKSAGADKLNLGNSCFARVPSNEPAEPVMRKPEGGESGDWLTVEEDDITSVDFS